MINAVIAAHGLIILTLVLITSANNEFEPLIWGPKTNKHSSGEHRRAQESAGEHRRAQESAGEHRRAVESAGEHRRAVESVGEHRRAVESTGEHCACATQISGEREGCSVAMATSRIHRLLWEREREKLLLFCYCFVSVVLLLAICY